MTAPRRRPRRANSLKDLGRLLNVADSAGEVSRSARLEAGAVEINNTEAFLDKLGGAIEAMDHLFQRFGVRAIACGSVLHIHEDWPGMDRRRVSGSVWDGRAPLSTAPWEGPVRCAHKDWKAARRQLSAWRGLQLFRQGGGVGALWLDEGPVGELFRFLKTLGIDQGAPVPLDSQRFRLGLSKTQTQGGPTPLEKRLATISRKKAKERVMALRDNDRSFLRECMAYERRELDLDDLIGPRVTAHEAYVRQVLKSPRKKPIDIGSRAGDRYRLDRDDLPRRLLVRETPRVEIDKSNLFDLIQSAGSVMNTCSEVWDNPDAKVTPVRNGVAARMLRKELKAQGIKSKVVEVPERTTFHIPDQAGKHHRACIRAMSLNIEP